ncbi:Gti1/Pac2 family-domain-containing protein [Cerioporus squamosus]|nr:Gti1/Pac2 family-domain-containing protein [Cerioporus squamosus]
MAMSTDTPLFEGFVDTTMDALRLIEAARRGMIPRVTRRLNDFERRTMVKSGAVFIFSVEESGIKRWTEGLAWSQSRISGNFLLYREVADRSTRTTQQLADFPTYRGHLPEPSLSYKPRGLVKKTITVKIDGSDYHLISYYTQEDLAAGFLRRPTSHPDLMAIEIPPELTRSTNFRYPPNLEEAHDTATSHGDRDAIDNQVMHAPGLSPPSPGLAGSIPSSPVGEDSSGLVHGAFARHAGDPSGYYYHSQSRLASLETGLTSSSPQGHSPVSAMAGIPTNTRAHPYARRGTGTSPSSWQSSVQAPYDPLASNAAAMYSSPTYSTHAHLTSAYDQRRDSWASLPALHQNMHHDAHRGVSEGSSDGSSPAVLSWSPTGSPIPGQSLASAPAVTFSAAANLPAGRARDHFRVRSYPSMQWQYEQAGVLPHSAQVHHHSLPYALDRGASAANAAGFHRFGGGEAAHSDR